MTTTINPTTINNTIKTHALNPGDVVTVGRAKRGIPLARLIRVESRKFLDTRSGKVLLAVAVILALAIGSISAYYFKSLAGDFETTQWWLIEQLMEAPFRILLPVMAALLVTTEWSQRTALTTFTLEPRRGRVLIAKAAVLVVMAIAATTLLLGTSALFSAIGGAHAHVTIDWSMGRGIVFPIAILLATMAMGFAFGLATMSSPGAIIATVVPPVLAAFMMGIGGRAEQIVNWTDLQSTLTMALASDATAMQWAKFAVAATIWIIIPATIGVIRHLRIEVK